MASSNQSSPCSICGIEGKCTHQHPQVRNRAYYGQGALQDPVHELNPLDLDDAITSAQSHQPGPQTQAARPMRACVRNRHSKVALCATCKDSFERISQKISHWPKIFRHDRYRANWTHGGWPEDHNEGMQLFGIEAKSIHKLLPQNVVKHSSHARNLLRSGRRCRFCAMIRDVLVVAQSVAESGGKLSDIDLGKILSASEYYATFLLHPRYSSSRVFLCLTRLQDPNDKSQCTLQDIEVVLISRNASTTTFPKILRGYIAVAAAEGTPAARAISTRPLPCPSDSDAAFSWLKSQIQDCDFTHLPCAFSVDRQLIGHPDDQVLPTRIIDILGEGLRRGPRLLETQGRMRGRWAALSHCWGDPKLAQLKTTTATLAQFLQEIPVDGMPQTFLDAVQITRKLGLRYLWIDSLCIIQDDEDDWKKESSLMGSVYQGAYFTISASDSPGSNHGCFNGSWYSKLPIQVLEVPFYSRRSPIQSLRRRGTFTVSIEWRHPGWCGKQRRPIHDVMDLVYEPRSDDTGLQDTILQSRGWVTQEWILSRRTIHYLRDHILWSCRADSVRDSGQEHRDVPYNCDILGVNWGDVVVEHSNREFTFPKDKLVSLSGLVTELGRWQHGTEEKLDERMTQRTCIDDSEEDPVAERWRQDFHGEYRFGLWSASIHDHLLWVPVGIAKDRHMAHCPSWSWASRAGRISYGIGDRAIGSHFLVKKPAAAAIKFSSSQVGSLIVRSKAKRISRLACCPITIEHASATAKTINTPFRIFEDLLKLPSRPESPAIHFYFGDNCDTASELGDEIGWICLDEGNFKHSLQSPATFFLLIGESHYTDHNRWMQIHEKKGRKSLYFGLIIVPLKNGKFQRIGLGTLVDSQWLDQVEAEEFELV